MAYATAEDIAVRLGRELEPAEEVLAAERLADAEELVRVRIPDLDAKVSAGTIRERVVTMVLCNAVLRIVKNQDGYSSESDGNYSYRLDPSIASGRLTIEPEEWAMLGLGSKLGILSYNLDAATAHLWRPWYADWYVPNPDQPGQDTAVWA